jgi:predicted Zn-dependent peptidase
VPAGLDGLAAISTRILLEIPDEGKVQALMSQAARLNYVCLEDVSIVVVECLSEHLEEALRLAAKIVQDPLISGLRVGRAKDLLKAYSRMDEDDPVTTGRNVVFSALYGGRGYGSLLYGTESSLAALDRKDVVSFIRRSVVKPNVFFGVQSDLDPGPVRALLEKFFDGIPNGPAPERTDQTAAVPDDRELVVHKSTRQSSVERAYCLPRKDLTDMAKGVLLETLLGKGPGSRLWSLRVDERLAYTVDADLTWTRTGGVLIAHLETGKARVPEAAAALGRVIDGLRDNGLADDELEAVRATAWTRFLRATEAKGPRLRTLGLYEALGLGPGSVADLLAAVKAVTREEMEAFIREVLDPARALKVTVGPGPETAASR